MAGIGHFYDLRGDSVFRIFAPERQQLAVVLPDSGQTLALRAEGLGYWTATIDRLPEGTRYLIELDGVRVPDVASRRQPEGVHGPSVIAAPVPLRFAGWQGVAIEDAIIYELHLGTFTPQGTLQAARDRLAHLQALGINVIELMPVAAFPGVRNWGYDGVQLFALHAAYGSYADLQQFIDDAHRHGIAVILDVVYNHFGPEGNHAAAFAPYTRQAATPWGDAINYDGPFSYGIRDFFLENLRYWLEDAGFDGVRMDAVALIADAMPVHILRQMTDLARSIGDAQGRTVLMIAEHLRNHSQVTSERGFHFDAQWNDDLKHAIFARITAERGRQHVNFGSFGDVRLALVQGFVLDGTRLDRYHHYFLGTDASGTGGHQHVVYMQNHDQVGNRPRSDRLIASYGREKALLALTCMMASPFVPMLFMGEEYGEVAPFLFFEDFSDARAVAGAREGRKAEFAFDGIVPGDPHAVETFRCSKLQWERAESPEGRAILDYYRQLIALKRTGDLGPRDRSRVRISADHLTEIIRLETAQTLTVLNFSNLQQPVDPGPEWEILLSSRPGPVPGQIGPLGALIHRKRVHP